MAGLVVDTTHLPHEGWHSPERGGVTWRTVFSSDRTPTADMVCGIAQLEAGTELSLHHHPQAEIYYGLAGTGTLTIGSDTTEIAAGVAAFIPGNTVHGVKAGPNGLSFLYVFDAHSFNDIAYTFLGQSRIPQHTEDSGSYAWAAQ